MKRFGLNAEIETSHRRVAKTVEAGHARNPETKPQSKRAPLSVLASYLANDPSVQNKERIPKKRI